MRLSEERVPLAGRNRRIWEELREEGVVGAQQEIDWAEILQSAIAEALEVLNASVEIADAEESDELMEETESGSETEEESSETEEESSETEEEEEPMFWEGIVEV